MPLTGLKLHHEFQHLALDHVGNPIRGLIIERFGLVAPSKNNGDCIEHRNRKILRLPERVDPTNVYSPKLFQVSLDAIQESLSYPFHLVSGYAHRTSLKLHAAR